MFVLYVLYGIKTLICLIFGRRQRHWSKSSTQLRQYISSITALEKSKSKKKVLQQKDDDDSEEVESDNESSNICYGLAFWIVFDWPEACVTNFEEFIAREIMSAELGVAECKTIKARGKANISSTEAHAASLFITIKDHSSAGTINLARALDNASVREAASSQRFDITGNLTSTAKPTQIVLTERLPNAIREEIVNGIESVKFTGINWPFYEEMSMEAPLKAQGKPTSKLLQAIDLIKRLLKENNDAWFNGVVYRKVPEGKYTYVYYKPIKQYLLHSMDNITIAEAITPYFTSIVNFLSEPDCRLVDGITIDYNYIEVLNGYCFNIKEKKFENPPTKLKGSPRTFVRYIYKENKVPYPKPFVEGIENSFPNATQRKRFYQKYYQILLHGQILSL